MKISNTLEARLSFHFLPLLIGFCAFAPQVLASATPASVIDLNGSVQISECSASVIELGRSEDDPAYLLSAGHCPRYPFLVAPGKSYSIPKNEWPKTFGFPLGTTLEKPSRIEIESLLYATLTNSDLALYRTKKTVREMRTLGYRVFTLGKGLPRPGTRLRVTSAFWKQTQVCTVDRILRNNAEEAEVDPSPTNGFTFRDSVFFDGDCQIRSGWSGSPLFDDRNGQIFGVASRRVLGVETDSPSLLGLPADLLHFIAFRFAASEFGTLIGANTARLQECLSPEGKLELKTRGCKLPLSDPKNAPGRGPVPRTTPSPIPFPTSLPAPARSTWPRH